MSENPYQSPDTETSPTSTRLDKMREWIRLAFRVLSLILGAVAIFGAYNAATQLDGQGFARDIATSMLLGALVAGLCAVMLFLISRRYDPRDATVRQFPNGPFS